MTPQIRRGVLGAAVLALVIALASTSLAPAKKKKRKPVSATLTMVVTSANRSTGTYAFSGTLDTKPVCRSNRLVYAFVSHAYTGVPAPPPGPASPALGSGEAFTAGDGSFTGVVQGASPDGLYYRASALPADVLPEKRERTRKGETHRYSCERARFDAPIP